MEPNKPLQNPDASQTEAISQADDATQADAPRFDGEQILVVDDNPSIRMTLQQTLQRIGLRVEAADGGEAALQWIGAHDAALVLLDLKMPGLDGQTVLEELQRRRPDVPVVIITAHGDVESAVETMGAGAANFVEKPFSVDAIRRVVRDTLTVSASDASGAGYDIAIGDAHQAIEARHLKAALEHARRALALDPLRPEAFNLMGIVMQLDMQIDKAQAYYRSALALDPCYVPAQTNLENTSSFPRRLGQFELK